MRTRMTRYPVLATVLVHSVLAVMVLSRTVMTMQPSAGAQEATPSGVAPPSIRSSAPGAGRTISKTPFPLPMPSPMMMGRIKRSAAMTRRSASGNRPGREPP